MTARRRARRCALPCIFFRTPPHVFDGWTLAASWMRMSPLLAVHREANDNAFSWAGQCAARRLANLERQLLEHATE